MMIAQVIVDVSAYPVDRPFDYLIPEQWEELIDTGCRVKVPFGPRNVLGFIVGLKQDTDVPLDKIKAVAEILDLESILTDEMLALAKWLKTQTICYEIDALQVMLPGALRAKYEKFAVNQVDIKQLPETLQAYFEKTSKVNIKQLEQAMLLKPLKQAIREGYILIENEVKQKGQVKQVRKVQIAELAVLEEVEQMISSRAQKQKQLVEWMKQNSGAVVTPDEITDALSITSAVLNSVIEKGAAQYIQEEVYRDPYTKDIVQTDF